jgi:hypothetical protein
MRAISLYSRMNCFGLSGWTRFFKWRGQNPCFNPSVISVSYFIGVLRRKAGH